MLKVTRLSFSVRLHGFVHAYNLEFAVLVLSSASIVSYRLQYCTGEAVVLHFYLFSLPFLKLLKSNTEKTHPKEDILRSAHFGKESSSLIQLELTKRRNPKDGAKTKF